MIRSPIRSPIRSAISGVFERRASGGVVFDPSSLFSSGEKGVWFDPSDFSSMFQDSAGTTPVTAVNQRVGKINDKSGNLAHATQATAGSRPTLRGTPTGAELAVNGDFASATGWTAGAGWAIGSGIATATASSAALSQAALTATAGNWYEITFSITRTAGTVQPQIGGATGVARSALGTYVDWIQATDTTAFQFNTAAFSGTVDNLSVKNASVGQVAEPYFLSFNGVDQSISTAAVDLTATDKLTAAFGARVSNTATQILFESGTNVASVAGSFAAICASTLQMSLRGATALSQVRTSTTTAYGFTAQRTYLTSFDIAGATASDEIKLMANGAIDAPIVQTAGPAGAGNFANLAIHIGRRGGTTLPFAGNLYQLILRGSASVESVRQQINLYINTKTQAYTPSQSVFALGDSTIAAHLGQNAVMDYVDSVYVKRSLAVPGNTIAAQQVAWESSANRDSPMWVTIQVGLNDLNPAEAASVAIGRLQALVNSVALLSPSTTKVFISKMTPCRASLISTYGGINGPIAYQKWLDMNESIAGDGATPITGVYGRITSHEPLLNDGVGNLAAAYNIDDIHENNAGREIIGQAWEAGISAAGVTV